MSPLIRVAVVGTLAYVALIVLLRLSGKRTLSKWNAFDFVVTVALGSILATVVLSRAVALADGLVAFVVLVGLQFAITSMSVRWRWVRRLVKSEPTLLLDRGWLLRDAMREQRVTESEVLAALRSAGISAVEDAFAVVLETDGSFSVLSDAPAGTASALADVKAPAAGPASAPARAAPSAD